VAVAGVTPCHRLDREPPEGGATVVEQLLSRPASGRKRPDGGKGAENSDAPDGPSKDAGKRFASRCGKRKKKKMRARCDRRILEGGVGSGPGAGRSSRPSSPAPRSAARDRAAKGGYVRKLQLVGPKPRRPNRAGDALPLQDRGFGRGSSWANARFSGAFVFACARGFASSCACGLRQKKRRCLGGAPPRPAAITALG